LSSTEYHQSFLNEILDVISVIEDGQEDDDEEMVFMMLIFLFTKFMESYNGCVKLEV